MTAYMESEKMHCWNFDHFFKRVSKERNPGLVEVNGTFVIHLGWTKASVAVFWYEFIYLFFNFVPDPHFRGRTSVSEQQIWFKMLNNIFLKTFLESSPLNFLKKIMKSDFILKICFSLTWNVWYCVFFLLLSPFFFINFCLHFPFFWNLKNTKDFKREKQVGAGGKRGRITIIWEERLLLSIFHFLHSKSKTTQRQGT